MNQSTQAKSKDAVKRLKSWLSSNPKIPMYRGKSNKTAICAKLQITRSTLNTNPELRRIFYDLDRSSSSHVQKPEPMHAAEMRRRIVSLETQVTSLSDQLRKLESLMEREILTFVSGQIVL